MALVLLFAMDVLLKLRKDTLRDTEQVTHWEEL